MDVESKIVIGGRLGMVGRYRPTSDLRAIAAVLNRDILLPFDHYFATMAAGDVALGRAGIPAVKSFFIRKGPWDSPFVTLFGLEEVLWVLQHLRLDNPDFIDAMKDMGVGDPKFLVWLEREKRLKVQVLAPPEGSLFVPSEPVVTFRGTLPHLRLVEGLVIEKFNFRSLVGLKALRCCLAAEGGKILEFGRRRAQNHLTATLYAHLGGCTATSNDEIRRIADIPAKGTMGHEWVQSFSSELEAFRAWVSVNPHAPILLVDTMATLESGVPNAIKAFDEYRDRIIAAKGRRGIRLDSGDLAYLTLASARMLSDSGYTDALIVLSSDLDEFEIRRIRAEIKERAGEFGLDPKHILSLLVWGVGTNLVTCAGNPALGGIAKLVEVNGNPVIKLSNDEAKVTIPGDNRSAWVFDEEGLVTVLVYSRSRYYIEDGHLFTCDGGRVVGMKMRDPNKPGQWTVLEKHHHLEARQKLIFDSSHGDGIALGDSPTLESVRTHVRDEVTHLHPTQQRTERPWKINLSLTEDLCELRARMREQRVLHASQLI